jgi:hypothetical protein
MLNVASKCAMVKVEEAKKRRQGAKRTREDFSLTEIQKLQSRNLVHAVVLYVQNALTYEHL